MWLLILLAAITFGNFILATPETVGSEYAPDDVQNDDSLFLYMDERSYDAPKSDHREIEARRRSALDKNFMRFGRSDGYFPKYNGYDTDDVDGEEFLRPERAHNKHDNFMRFGRGRPTDFMRFGRDPYKMSRMSRGIKDKNFIRFGRSVALKRNRRDVYSEGFDKQYKRANNRDMLRFGRRDNYLRFGRIPEAGTQEKELLSNETDVKKEKIFPPRYSTLLDLLNELAFHAEREPPMLVPRLG